MSFFGSLIGGKAAEGADVKDIAVPAVALAAVVANLIVLLSAAIA